MKPAILYARFSPRPNPSDCDSIEKQLERCRAYATSCGYAVTETCADANASGGSTDGRPELERAISLACQQQAVLVVYDLSRLARNVRDALNIAERLNRAGADLASVQERIDTNSAMGKFVFTLFAALAELQRSQICERTSIAMLKHQRNGRVMSRIAPYGWRKAGKVLEPDADERKIIELIVRLRSQGNGLHDIRRELEQYKITCRGGRWHTSTIAKIIRRDKDETAMEAVR